MTDEFPIEYPPMRSAMESFRDLERQLQIELNLDPAFRSNEYRTETLSYFQINGRTREEHDLWRESHMISKMLEIMRSRYMALNPHIEILLRMQSLPPESLEWVEFQQSVDDSGQTEEEMCRAQKTLFPCLPRNELELLAAEAYLINDLGVTPCQATKAVPSLQPRSSHNNNETANQKISYEDLCKELAHFVGEETF